MIRLPAGRGAATRAGELDAAMRLEEAARLLGEAGAAAVARECRRQAAERRKRAAGLAARGEE